MIFKYIVYMYKILFVHSALKDQTNSERNSNILYIQWSFSLLCGAVNTKHLYRVSLYGLLYKMCAIIPSPPSQVRYAPFFRNGQFKAGAIFARIYWLLLNLHIFAFIKSKTKKIN